MSPTPLSRGKRVKMIEVAATTSLNPSLPSDERTPLQKLACGPLLSYIFVFWQKFKNRSGRVSGFYRYWLFWSKNANFSNFSKFQKKFYWPFLAITKEYLVQRTALYLKNWPFYSYFSFWAISPEKRPKFE